MPQDHSPTLTSSVSLNTVVLPVRHATRVTFLKVSHMFRKAVRWRFKVVEPELLCAFIFCLEARRRAKVYKKFFLQTFPNYGNPKARLCRVCLNDHNPLSSHLLITCLSFHIWNIAKLQVFKSVETNCIITLYNSWTPEKKDQEISISRTSGFHEGSFETFI